MKRFSDEIIQFFNEQGFVIVSTIDRNGSVHNSCKGIVKINKNGSIYLLDLYHGRTYKNLKQNPNISITSVNENKFRGYTLKGKAKIIGRDKIDYNIIRAWEERITNRITQRVIKAIQGEKGHPRHPEALLPNPQYLIIMEVEEIIDLAVHHLKHGG